jgi:hypothetical protein
LNLLPKKLANISVEHGESFYQDIAVKERQPVEGESNCAE